MKLFKNKYLFIFCFLILAGCQHASSAGDDSESGTTQIISSDDLVTDSSFETDTDTHDDTDTQIDPLLDEWVIVGMTLDSENQEIYKKSQLYTDTDSGRSFYAVNSFKFSSEEMPDSYRMVGMIYGEFCDFDITVTDSGKLNLPISFCGFIMFEPPAIVTCSESQISPELCDQQTQDMIQILGTVTNYKIEDDMLYLFNDDKSNELQLQRKDAFLDTLK